MPFRAPSPACALATQFARQGERRTLLVDLDLQFGDVAIMMGIEPEKTIFDLVMTTGELDPDKLARLRHRTTPRASTSSPPRCGPRTPSSSPRTASATCSTWPRRPTTSSWSTRPPHFHATTLATLDRTDRLVLVATLDIPTVKNVKLTLQTLNLLHYPRERIAPRAQPRRTPRAELQARATSSARST